MVLQYFNYNFNLVLSVTCFHHETVVAVMAHDI
uniref:Uncharacterized protein n=1 Tax=Anguilla anguilla TaxID=7936 RepID=A0A0E9RI81_ANGAN